jgi:NAD(P)-dependent dehydrogenase (short-subunit alcohol dehydrogenase family)
MPTEGSVVIVGGSRGLGREVARHYASVGDEVVVTGLDGDAAAASAAEIGGRTRGFGLDLAKPHEIAASLADVGPVKYLVISAIDRDQNTVREYDIDRAVRLATIKLVGYTEVVHALLDRISDDSAIVLYGGLAKERPYPGSTTVTTVNGGVVGLVVTLATELAPIRVNALHPGIVGDSAYWKDRQAALERTLARTPTKRLATMADIVHATRFLLENRSVNAIDLRVDGGWMIF